MSGNRLISDESPSRVSDLEQALRSGNDECRVEESGDDECREDGGDRCEAEAAPNTGTAKEINILSLDYGYIVKVGCQKIAVESVDRLIANLYEYLTNPSATERKWFKEKKLL